MDWENSQLGQDAFRPFCCIGSRIILSEVRQCLLRTHNIVHANLAGRHIQHRIRSNRIARETLEDDALVPVSVLVVLLQVIGIAKLVISMSKPV